MASAPIHGLLAGAVGTMALDTVTYLDMALRGRAASEVPAQMAGRFADRFGLDLGDGHGPGDGATAEHRRQAIGALLGYATGAGVGVVAGLVGLQRRSFLTGALAAGLGAMAATDTAAIRAGVTDPRAWGPSGWLADLVPHLAYGAATVAALRTFGARRPGLPTR